VLVLDRGALIAAGDPASVRENRRVRDVYLGVE
jgi:ABC-type branched-subunit amino acid transport system ATPase component